MTKIQPIHNVIWTSCVCWDCPLPWPGLLIVYHKVLLELSLAMGAALMWVDLANTNVSSLITCHKGTFAHSILGHGICVCVGGGGGSSF